MSWHFIKEGEAKRQKKRPRANKNRIKQALTEPILQTEEEEEEKKRDNFPNGLLEWNGERQNKHTKNDHISVFIWFVHLCTSHIHSHAGTLHIQSIHVAHAFEQQYN